MADDILARGEASAPYIDTISFYDLKEPGGDDYFYLTKVEQKRGRRGFHIDLGSSELPLGIERSGFSAIPGNPGVGEEGEAKWSEVIRSSKSRVVLSGVGGDEFLGGVPDPRPQLADLVLQFRLGKLIRQLAAWSLAKRRPWIQLFLESLVLLLPNGVRSRFDNQCKGESWIGSSVERQASFATVRFGPRETFGFWLPSRKEYARTLVMIGRELECVNPPKGACFERRYPYLDRTLLEFLISIPADQLLRAGERRSLMRRALAQILPPEVLSRRTKAHPARSYMVPLERRWPEIESVLSSSLCGLRGQIDVGYLRESLVAAKNGKTAHLARLLRVLSLESWLQDVTARGFVTAETKSLFAVGMRTVQSGV